MLTPLIHYSSSYFHKKIDAILNLFKQFFSVSIIYTIAKKSNKNLTNFTCYWNEKSNVTHLCTTSHALYQLRHWLLKMLCYSFLTLKPLSCVLEYQG